MARVSPPTGKTWNQYIKEQANAAGDQSIANLRLVKRNIKLGQIAEVDRQAGGNVSAPNYREYNTYVSPGTVAPAVAHPWLNVNYVAGLYVTTYTGYFADNVAFFNTASVVSSNVTLNVIGSLANNPIGGQQSQQYLGYFKPTTTETYTFYLSSDDGSYLWLGHNSLVGYTTSNALINDGSTHGPTELSASVALVAGTYYPIRVQFGDNTLSGNPSNELLVSYSTPTINKTSTFTNKIFYNTLTNGF